MNFKDLLAKHPKGEPAPKKPSVKIPAVRTCCVNRTPKRVEVECWVEFHDSLNSWWVMMSGGVAGYESARVEMLLNEGRTKWPACCGTPGRWDALVVEKEGLDILLDWLAQQPELREVFA